VKLLRFKHLKVYFEKTEQLINFYPQKNYKKKTNFWFVSMHLSSLSAKICHNGKQMFRMNNFEMGKTKQILIKTKQAIAHSVVQAVLLAALVHRH